MWAGFRVWSKWLSGNGEVKLVHHADISEREVVRRFGYRPWGAGVMLLLVLGGPVGAFFAFGGATVGLLPWWGWLVASPMVLIALLIWGVVIVAAYRALSACFRSTNWVMKVAHTGVYLQYRSYLNYHFADEGPTVVFVGFDEIASARKTIHHTRGVDSEGDERITGKKWLEMRLGDVDTEDLRAAAASEAAPRKGVGGRSRFHHVPVWVSGSGVVRVEWRGRGMLRSFPGSVSIGPVERTGVGYEGDGGESRLEEQIIELMEQGRRMGAVKLIRRRYAMNLTQATRFADELAGRLAEPASAPGG